MTTSLPSVPSRAGLLVKAARERAGMTQAEVARKVGWRSPSYVARIEAGRAVTLDNLNAIAIALGRSLHALVPGRCR